VHLTPIEYNLLRTLVQHAGKVVTQTQLLKEVWGPAYSAESHYLRVYMSQLRRKIRNRSGAPALSPHRTGRGLSAEGGIETNKHAARCDGVHFHKQWIDLLAAIERDRAARMEAAAVGMLSDWASRLAG